MQRSNTSSEIMTNQNNSKINVDAEIEQLLKSVAEEEGLSYYEIEKAPGSMKGDGYLGVITAIRITGTDESKKTKVLNLVVKSASKSDALRVETPIADVFEREIYMYNVVIPAFQKFESEKGLPLFSSSAKCYKACLINKSEALILENLKDKGYSVWERRIPMEHDHVSFVMAEYGRFHAISYALRDQHPERFEKLTTSMYDIFHKFLEKADFTKMFSNQCVKAQEALDPVADKEALKVFKSFNDEKLKSFFTNLPDFVDKYSVVLHGDCWTNNMMFKYEDTNDPTKPTKMCLIDLQISRVGPPVLDLSYYFYACSSKKVISNFEHYLDVYYNSLSAHIRKLGSDPDEVYPYSVFKQQWKETAKFGLICSMLLIHVMLSEQDEVTDLADAAESGKSVVDAFNYDIANSEVYNDRVRHVILHFVNNKFI